MFELYPLESHENLFAIPNMIRESKSDCCSSDRNKTFEGLCSKQNPKKLP